MNLPSSFIFLLAAELLPWSGFAAERASARYHVPADTVSGGGGKSASARFGVQSSLGGIVGASASASARVVFEYGYIAQLGTIHLEPSGIADLAVVLSGFPTQVTLGNNAVCAFTVLNVGPDAAPGARLTVTLPAGSRLISVVLSQGIHLPAGNLAVCELGDLGAGSSATATIIAAPGATGSFAITAAASSSSTDPFSTNNSISATIQVVPPATESTVITRNTTVLATDTTTIEGKHVTVNTNVTLVLAGQHRVASLTVAGTVTHGLGDTNGMNLVVDGLFEVQPGGKVDVTAKGYRGGYRDGNTNRVGETRGTNGAPTTIGGADGMSGGSYGSPGQSVGGNANALYGSETAPAELGSGGATDQAYRPGGNGGGRVEIEAGSMIVNGQILANGGEGGWYFAGGSGGAIWLRSRGGGFSGTGLLEARGGGVQAGAGIGGGGRIAVTGFGNNQFAGTLGRAGTVFVQAAGTGGDLILDTTMLSVAANQTNTYGTILCSTNGASTILNQGTLAFTTDGWTVPGGVTLVQEGVLKGAARQSNYLGNLTVASNALITHTRGLLAGVQLRVADRFEIQAGGKIDVTAKGYRGGYRDGNTNRVGETRGTNGAPTTAGGADGMSGGSYGSLGQSVGGNANALYGSETAPAELGSGGATDLSSRPGGNGGGRLEVEAGSIIVNGQILANGGEGGWYFAGGSGGAIWLRINGGGFSGTGLLEARGGRVQAGAGTGGGGRIAVTGFGNNQFAGTLGRAATVFVQAAGTGGDLILDTTVLSIAANQTNTYGTILCSTNGASTILNQGALAFTTDGWTVPGGVTLVQDGVIKGAARQSNYLGSLTVASNALITHTRGLLAGVQLRVADRFEIQAGGKIDVTAKGYRGGYRDGNTNRVGETRGTNGVPTTAGGADGMSGGSYGSLGQSVGGNANALYGSETAPAELGSGGATDQASRPGGNGGGRVEMEAGSIIVNGQILANGGEGGWYFAGGSGGAIWLRINGGGFSGAGLLEARGGRIQAGAGIGGGGRIAVTGYAGTNFTGTIAVGGGTLYWAPGIARDSDGDELPDDYELAHGMNPNLASDALLDTDGDGHSNLEEFRAGTDPRDRTSVLKLDLSFSNARLVLIVPTVSGKRYCIQTCSSLGRESWQARFPDFTGDGRTASFADAGPATPGSRFYRVVLLP
jgi:hypothetical protein